MKPEKIINPKEAPAGFYAVSKDSVPNNSGNICRYCDWRPECQKDTTDHHAWGHRCRAYPITVIDTGQIHARDDGCSVLFKKLPE